VIREPALHKATFDIPDDLYRSVKARSALEGRPLRAVAIELFRKWLEARVPSESESDVVSEAPEVPRLDIARRYVRPGMSYDMDPIRQVMAEG
jgi:hypothetical protein